jgi:hypothetical protein
MRQILQFRQANEAIPLIQAGAIATPQRVPVATRHGETEEKTAWQKWRRHGSETGAGRHFHYFGSGPFSGRRNVGGKKACSFDVPSAAEPRLSTATW